MTGRHDYVYRTRMADASGQSCYADGHIWSSDGKQLSEADMINYVRGRMEERYRLDPDTVRVEFFNWTDIPDTAPDALEAGQ